MIVWRDSILRILVVLAMSPRRTSVTNNRPVLIPLLLAGWCIVTQCDLGPLLRGVGLLVLYERMILQSDKCIVCAADVYSSGRHCERGMTIPDYGDNLREHGLWNIFPLPNTSSQTKRSNFPGVFSMWEDLCSAGNNPVDVGGICCGMDLSSLIDKTKHNGLFHNTVYSQSYMIPLELNTLVYTSVCTQLNGLLT